MPSPSDIEMRMLYAVVLFAEDKQPDANPFGGIMIPFLIMMVLFFFFIIMPARRRERQQRESLFANLKKNDEVVTMSGIIGIVANIHPTKDEVTLKVDESSNLRIRVLRSSIARIMGPEDAAKEGTTDTGPSK
jgi:preprotein translocase subunit YajC